jgi:hypothetical protein
LVLDILREQLIGAEVELTKEQEDAIMRDMFYAQYESWNLEDGIERYVVWQYGLRGLNGRKQVRK